MSSFQIYLFWMVMPSLGYFFATVSVLLFISLLVIAINTAVNDDDMDDEKIKHNWSLVRKFSIICVSLLFVTVFIPSKTDIATIYLAPKIINNESVQKIPDEILKYIHKQLNEE